MIFGYHRASTDDQKSSLEEQKRKTKGLAMIRTPDLSEYAPFTDEDVSGSTPLSQRPAGRDMLLAATKGDTLVSTKLDRMFRSAKDALIVMEQLHEKGIDVVLMDISMEPISNDNHIAHLFFTISAAFAEFERRQIAGRMREGKVAKLRRGGHTGGEAPYGFALSGHGRDSILVPVDEEQAVVAEVMKLHRDKVVMMERGMGGPYSICRRLSMMGYKTRSGKDFTAEQVNRIIAYQLRNEKYAAA